jgi:Family of unknown function (DUF6600)
MKAIRASVLAIVILLVAGVTASSAHAAVSFSFFYSNLSPHGTWLVSGQYGRVWQPGVYRAGWNPYYDGHWVYADVGWTWVSDYGWGDVPYHYGTWYEDSALGWVWVPGYVWAPAWVVFRTGPDYIGWAPVVPGYSVGASFSYGSPAGSFVFVSAGHFCDTRVRRYIVPEVQTRTIVNQTRIVNNLTIEKNIVVNRGPDPRMIERASGRRVRTVSIESVPRAAPGGNVNRAELAVEPQRGSRGLRAAQPVSERQPLPQPHERGQGNGHQNNARVAAPPPPPRPESTHQGPRHEAAPRAPAHSAPAHTAPAPPHRSQPPAPSTPHGNPAGHGKPHDGHPHDNRQNS